jgi:hypothetical protein
MLDVSEGGMRCLVGIDDAPGLREPVRTMLGVSGRLFPVRGVVVRRRARGRQMELGIAFRELAPEQVALLRRFVAEVLAERAGSDCGA